MINRQMQAVEVWEQGTGQDMWGNPTGETLVCSIDCAINTVQGTNISKDVNYTEITHFGLTAYRGLKKGQYLKSNSGIKYLIDKPPVENTRFAQLFLKEVI